MSQSNVEKVRNLVIQDPALQTRLGAAKGEKDLTDTLVKIGAEKGMPFTAADVDAWKIGIGASVKLNEELSEEQLKSVSGGMVSYGSSIFCGFCGKTSGSFKITGSFET